MARTIRNEYYARVTRFLDGDVSVLRSCATYWHFVVGLWPILYVAVYLV